MYQAMSKAVNLKKAFLAFGAIALVAHGLVGIRVRTRTMGRSFRPSARTLRRAGLRAYSARRCGI
jgi:hypothetical protein